MSELKPGQMDKQRAIDILWAEIGNNQQPLYCTRKELCDAVELAEESILRAQPANEPLTLDELRGMDGEPVYMVYAQPDNLNGWMLSWDAADYVDEERRLGATAYRRKPEGSESDA